MLKINSINRSHQNFKKIVDNYFRGVYKDF